MILKQIVRCATAMLVFAIAAATPVRDIQAQAPPPNLPPSGAYQPVPNFTGAGAGALFRKAINDRFSGNQATSPTVLNVAFQNLPAEQNGALIFCKDCKRSNPCAVGGSGAWALGTRGAWSCSQDALEASLSAGGNKITNLGGASIAGDALGFGQSASGDLSGALPNPIVQTVLNGKAPVYANQTNPQFQTLARPVMRSAGPVCTQGACSTASLLTLSAPAGAQPGDVEVAFVFNGIASAVTYTPPSGWTQVAGSLVSNNSQQLVEFVHVVSNSEPASYGFAWSVPSSYAQGQILDFLNVNVLSPIDSVAIASSGSSTSNTLTVSAPSNASNADLNLVIGAFDNQPLTLASPPATALNVFAGYYSWGEGAWAYSSPASPATITVGIPSHALAAQIALKPAPYGPANALLDGQSAGTLSNAFLIGTTSIGDVTLTGAVKGVGSNASLSTINLNGAFNVQAFGAGGDGIVDDAPAIQSAIDACVSSNAPCEVHFPRPSVSYRICEPLFLHGPSIRLSGPNTGSTNQWTISQDANCPATAPFFVLQNYTMSGVTLGAPLISGSTHSMDGSANRAPVDLNDSPAMDPYPDGTRGLNGSPTMTAEAYVKLNTTANGEITTIYSRRVSAEAPTGAFELGINGAHFQGWVSVNGVRYILSDTTTVLATNTLYHVAITFDGTTIRLFTNGALVASGVHAGTVTHNWWEVAGVGGYFVDYPDNSPNGAGGGSINGLIDGVRISKVARYTAAFTPCNCEPVLDSNTLAIASFDNNLRMLTQLDYFLIGNHHVLSYVRRSLEDAGGTEQGPLAVQIENLSMHGGSSIGIIGQNFNQCTFEGLTFAGTNIGIDEFGNDYENYFKNIFLGTVGYIGVTAINDDAPAIWENVDVQPGLVGFRMQSGVLINPIVQAQFNTVWSYNIQGDSSFANLTCIGCSADTENETAAFYKGGLLLDNMEAATFNGGNFDGRWNGPAVEISGGSNTPSAVFTGINFSSDDGSTVIHISNSGAGLGGVNIAGSYKNHPDATTPWTDTTHDDILVQRGGRMAGTISSVTGGIANATPTVGSCGTGASVASGGTNNAFAIAVGSTNPTASCAVSFGTATAFTNQPVCTATDVSQGFALKQSALSITGVTLTAPPGITDMHGDTINMVCIGK